MDEVNKNRLVITKLIQETQRGSITWQAIIDENIVLPYEGEVIDKVYLTEYKGTRFRIFRFRYKDFESDLMNFSYSSAIRLEILDKNDNLDWDFPTDNSLDDLYETIRYKVADVNRLFDDILGLEIIKAEYRTNKKSCDITNILKSKIENNELHILASNDIAGDPDYGTVKTLKIKYYYLGKLFEKEIKENQMLDIP